MMMFAQDQEILGFEQAGLRIPEVVGLEFRRGRAAIRQEDVGRTLGRLSILAAMLGTPQGFFPGMLVFSAGEMCAVFLLSLGFPFHVHLLDRMCRAREKSLRLGLSLWRLWYRVNHSSFCFA